jgi:hypothetical protein
MQCIREIKKRLMIISTYTCTRGVYSVSIHQRKKLGKKGMTEKAQGTRIKAQESRLTPTLKLRRASKAQGKTVEKLTMVSKIGVLHLQLH